MTQLNPTLNRRALLKGTGFVALSFTIPLTELGAQSTPVAPLTPLAPVLPPTPTAPAKPKLVGSLDTNRKLSSWLRVNANGTVTLFVGKVELGQGILVAVQQVCADELDVNFERVQIVSGDTALVPNEGVTAGSFSMPNCASAVQMASAEVRALLLELAAARLGVGTADLSIADGVISGSGKRVSYWDLVADLKLEREATHTVKPKAPNNYRYMGKSVPRQDLTDKFLGKPIFIQELRPADVLYGQVVRPPTYAARLKEGVNLMAIFDKVAKSKGVVKVVKDGSFLGVIAKREEEANAAAAQMGLDLQAANVWDIKKNLPSTQDTYQWLKATKVNRIIPTKTQARSDSRTVAKSLSATYYRPYQMHASIGPSAAIAKLQADGVYVVQTHSQSVFETAWAMAQMLGVTREKVRLQHIQGSGCYGHNMADDAAADAALLARAVPGRSVKLQYTREGEHRWEPYGSAMVLETKANVDAAGDVLDWDLDIWSTPHGARPQGMAGNLLSAQYLEKPFPQPVPGNAGAPNYAADRNGIALYDFAGQNVRLHFITDMPVRVSSHRGLGAYGNVFAIESFIDELAVAAKADPVAYRLKHMKDSRSRDAIVQAAQKFGWDKTKGTTHGNLKRGKGFAYSRYKNIATYCAVALEVEVDTSTGVVRVLRAVASADAGQIVSPDGVVNQIEGGLIQSLSWTLKEEVQFDQTRILSEDWASYPILTFSEVPPVEVVLIDRVGQPFLGAGEASQGPTGAALANAIFDATGVRLRQIPFTPERVKRALAGASVPNFA